MSRGVGATLLPVAQTREPFVKADRRRTASVLVRSAAARFCPSIISDNVGAPAGCRLHKAATRANDGGRKWLYSRKFGRAQYRTPTDDSFPTTKGLGAGR
jgi:hypothetical protein